MGCRQLRDQASAISMSPSEAWVKGIGEASAKMRASQRSTSGANASLPRVLARHRIGCCTMVAIFGRSAGLLRIASVTSSTSAGERKVKSMMEKSSSRMACHAAVISAQIQLKVRLANVECTHRRHPEHICWWLPRGLSDRNCEVCKCQRVFASIAR